MSILEQYLVIPSKAITFAAMKIITSPNARAEIASFTPEGSEVAEHHVIIHVTATQLPFAGQLKAIDDMLAVAYEKGNASLAIPCHETVIYTEDQKSGDKELDRSKLMRVQTPQAYRYGEILPLYERAEKENKHDFIYADLVAIYYGVRVYFSKGFTNNIKVTSPEDLPLCESLMSFDESQLYSR